MGSARTSSSPPTRARVGNGVQGQAEWILPSRELPREGAASTSGSPRRVAVSTRDDGAADERDLGLSAAATSVPVPDEVARRGHRPVSQCAGEGKPLFDRRSPAARPLAGTRTSTRHGRAAYRSSGRGTATRGPPVAPGDPTGAARRLIACRAARSHGLGYTALLVDPSGPMYWPLGGVGFVAARVGQQPIRTACTRYKVVTTITSRPGSSPRPSITGRAE